MEYISNSGKIITEDTDFLKTQLEQLNSDYKVDLSEYKYIFDDPNMVKKQTDAQYEIYISLVANILENVDSSEYPESKSICSNNYFIPVPSGQDHNKYLKAFIEYIEKSMIGAASNE